MKFTEFKGSVDGDAPPAGLGFALEALWYAAKGDWHKAHKLAQREKSDTGAWVHAYLHRVEGDLSNAGFWYRKAGRPDSSAALEEEWREIAEALL